MTSVAETRLPFGPASNRWLSSLRTDGKSPLTIDCYSRDLRDVAAALQVRDTRQLAKVDQTALDKMAHDWTCAGVSPATRYRRLCALRSFARFLTASVGISCGGILAAQLPSVERLPRPIPSDGQMDDLLSWCSIAEGDWESLRDDAINLLMNDAGLSAAEAVALDLGDIGKSAVNVRSTTFTPRTVAITDRVKSALEQYRSTVLYPLALNGPLFVNRSGTRISVRTVQVRFRDRVRLLGIVGVIGPSSLRCRCGTKLAAQSGSSDIVASVLGLHPLSTHRLFNRSGGTEI
ncbi:tyrosine-type recombinase/integrase [Bradyrhizobium cosmicum]|uniref:tyrosine-type recombinase/integrase n=1 Tax=Bradyrhizobium cosmicum TaxID=1404864 RepID=UPI0011622EEC|nr:tyrosine-type recombinase/integrase [Bradyrhizobium cosmicum]QDP26163.1 tyrosine-type recombinase/integrase [Bradyrhizobium cosmicum]